MCTAQSRVALCVYCTVYRGTVCVFVLHSLERHCVCTAQSREVRVCSIESATLDYAVHTLTTGKYAVITPTTSISTDTIEPLL